mmetsp:Transcript_20928/g.67412  ORF Transcript_20928/g.67412 Transcript_20928/m.67412 type:complete len:134 (+) Transcript_20928:39-440(+)
MAAANAWDAHFEVIDGNIFCALCHNFVPLPAVDPIKCEYCLHTVNFEESGLGDLVIEYASEPRPNPKWATDDPTKTKEKPKVTKTARTTIEETCPECGHPELEYYTMQLRSADEGQTVFYECPKCGHKYSQNN